MMLSAMSVDTLKIESLVHLDTILTGRKTPSYYYYQFVLQIYNAP